ncbi:hypothetical protein ScPMuIL_011975 [Solemya velum]
MVAVNACPFYSENSLSHDEPTGKQRGNDLVNHLEVTGYTPRPLTKARILWEIIPLVWLCSVIGISMDICQKGNSHNRRDVSLAYGGARRLVGGTCRCTVSSDYVRLWAIDVRLQSVGSETCDGAVLSWGEEGSVDGTLACPAHTIKRSLYRGSGPVWVSLTTHRQPPAVVRLVAATWGKSDVRVDCQGFESGNTSGTKPTHTPSPPTDQTTELGTPLPTTSTGETPVSVDDRTPYYQTTNLGTWEDLLTGTSTLPTTTGETTSGFVKPVSDHTVGGFTTNDTQGDADEVTIVGAVLGTVALIVCVVVGIVVWRRHQHKFHRNTEDVIGLQVEWTERKGVEITGPPFNPIPAPSMEPYMWRNRRSITKNLNEPIYELAGPIDCGGDNRHVGAETMLETRRKLSNINISSIDEVVNNVKTMEEDRKLVKDRHENVNCFINENYVVSNKTPSNCRNVRTECGVISTEAIVHFDAHGNNCTKPATTGGVDTERHDEQIPCDAQTTQLQESGELVCDSQTGSGGLDELKNDIDEILRLF